MSDPLSSSLTLMRRLPPTLTEKSLTGLSKLLESEDVLDQVCQRVDKPLKIGQCQSTGGEFILCEFNKDGDSYRSPWSNLYQPPTSEGIALSDSLRKLEVKANEVFNEYRRLYYDGGISSVYFWDVSPTAFACAFLIKRDLEQKNGVEKASWESSNLIQAEIDVSQRTVQYSVTSTVFLQIDLNDPNAGQISMSGGLSRQTQEFKPCSDVFAEAHVYYMISLVENMESKLRGSLDMVYVAKTKEIIDKTRHIEQPRGRVKLA